MKSIIVIDDCTILTNSIADQLQGTGEFLCHSFPSLADALRPGAPASSPDIILVDPSRQGETPAEIRAALLHAFGEHETIAYLPHGADRVARRCLAEGFSGAISRATSIEGLVSALDCVGIGGIYVDHCFGPIADLGAEPGAPRLDGLTARELDVLMGLARGGASKEIARDLSISPSTVETHKARGMNKLGLRSRSDVLQHAIANDWLG